MNTLGSWIDQEALAGIARDLAPPSPAEAVPWFADAATPVTRLMADDFRLPEHFAPAPFPEPPDAMPAPEREKARHFLDHIRHKAEKSGLIPKLPAGAPSAGPAEAADLPPWGPSVPAPAQGPVAASDLGAMPPRRHVPHFEVPLGPLTIRQGAQPGCQGTQRHLEVGNMTPPDRLG